MTADRAGESVLVGRFNGPWGVRGWVRVYSYTRPPAAIFEYLPWRVGDHGETITVEQWRQNGSRLVAQLSGIDTPEQAAALGHDEIHVAREHLPAPSSGEYYWHDLVGAEVVNLQDHVYGRVARLLETGANDVLEIVSPDGQTVLIPFVQGEFVHSVDLAAGRITVDWPLEWVDSE